MSAVEKGVVWKGGQFHLVVSAVLVIFAFTVLTHLSHSPHLGKGRCILPGQKIHGSIMESDNVDSVRTRKASLGQVHGLAFPRDWQDLARLEHSAKALPQWIELDLYDVAVECLQDIRQLFNTHRAIDRQVLVQRDISSLIHSRVYLLASICTFSLLIAQRTH